MANVKTYKCSFKHCLHESPEVSGDVAIKVGNRYMHPDCAKTYEYINKTRDLYYQNISNTVVMPQLMKTINNIIFNKHIEAEYLYFALNYAIKNKINVKSPYGLHYIIDYQNIKNAWKKKKADEVRKEMVIDQEEQQVVPHKFNYTPTNHQGFDSIFGK